MVVGNIKGRTVVNLHYVRSNSAAAQIGVLVPNKAVARTTTETARTIWYESEAYMG
jgi:hypothetical protein